MASIQLQGKIFLTGDIKAVTGLHIGGDSDNLDIGGIDNPVIRNPLSREPYIPGSSLRGKIRSLLDRHLNRPLHSMGGVQVHSCKTPNDYDQCSVCQVFGVAPTGKLRGKTMPTRLIVGDVSLTETARQDLAAADTDGEFTEAKWEVTIDRITAEANPRQNERVPAGATFGPFQLIYGLYTRNTMSKSQIEQELELFDTVLAGMQLLKDDYLGGSGSRGSGRIEFANLEMIFKPRTYYEKSETKPVPIKKDTDIETLRSINYKQKILNALDVQ